MPKRSPKVTPFPLPVIQLLLQWADVIRAQRQQMQLPMRDFAYRLNISLDTLQRMEHGEPSVQASTYLNAMLVLGVIDQLCPSPQEALMVTSRIRVRSKKAIDSDEYF